ncbi:MAG: hypothetical protein KIH67_000180 [Candidatus Moranbacteria bacterium]|nr:hypothetical protein [Candidatus Moranbacteria bacterium]
MQEQELVTTENEQAFFSALRNEVLSSEEKAQIRESLVKRIDVGRPSFFQKIAFVWPAIYSKPAFGLAVFSVMMLLGIGVVKASESALPGDTLYKAKTALYEPVSEILSQKDATAEAKESIRRRFDEAKILAADGRLGTDEKFQIENLIEADLQKIESQGEMGAREEVVSMGRDYEKYFMVVLDGSRRIRIQMLVAPTEIDEARVMHQDKSSTQEEKEDDDDENEHEDDDEESAQSGVKKKSSHEDEEEEDEEEKKVVKSKGGSSGTGSSHSQEEDEEEREEEEEEEDNSGSGSNSNDEDDDEDDEEEEEEEEEK